MFFQKLETCFFAKELNEADSLSVTDVRKLPRPWLSILQKSWKIYKDLIKLEHIMGLKRKKPSNHLNITKPPPKKKKTVTKNRPFRRFGFEAPNHLCSVVSRPCWVEPGATSVTISTPMSSICSSISQGTWLREGWLSRAKSMGSPFF